MLRCTTTPFVCRETEHGQEVFTSPFSHHSQPAPQLGTVPVEQSWVQRRPLEHRETEDSTGLLALFCSWHVITLCSCSLVRMKRLSHPRRLQNEQQNQTGGTCPCPLMAVTQEVFGGAGDSQCSLRLLRAVMFPAGTWLGRACHRAKPRLPEPCIRTLNNHRYLFILISLPIVT